MVQDHVSYNYPAKQDADVIDANEARVVMMMMQDLPVTDDVLNYVTDQSISIENKDDVILRHDYKDYVHIKQQQLQQRLYLQQQPQQKANQGGTPAMSILDDVTNRTRNLLRDIGSRPLSDDLDKYFQGWERVWER